MLLHCLLLAALFAKTLVREGGKWLSLRAPVWFLPFLKKRSPLCLI